MTDVLTAARPAASPPVDRANIFGQAAWLFMRSPAHRHLFVADLEWLLVPPLTLQQFRLYRRQNAPVAFVSWALLTAEVEQRVRSGGWRLQPTDWRGGDRLWIVDLVAPHGGVDAVLKGLRTNVFPDRVFNLVRTDLDNGAATVAEVRGVKVRGVKVA